MDLTDDDQRARWRAHLEEPFRDRLVVTGLLAAAARRVHVLSRAARAQLPGRAGPAGHRRRARGLDGRELRRPEAADADATAMAGLLRFLDAELGTGFGPVEVAPDVRG